MAKNDGMYDINWQRINAEICEKENRIRRRWFIKNRQQLIDNLDEDHVGDAVRNKLKQLKEYHEQWKIEEPEKKLLEEEKQPSTSVETIDTNYMYPVDPSVIEILYTKGPDGHEGRKNYLKRRNELKPEDRFFSAECTNWEYGWRLKDFPKVIPAKLGKKLIIQESFYRKNASSLNREPDLTRKIQTTHIKPYDAS